MAHAPDFEYVRELALQLTPSARLTLASELRESVAADNPPKNGEHSAENGGDEAAAFQIHRARVMEALKGHIVDYSDIEDESDLISDEMEEEMLRELREATRGIPPLSEDIIRERREGP